MAKLRENGMVKGVSWDPIGKYLAAQVIGGEEKCTVVWRVRDWQVNDGGCHCDVLTLS